MKKKVIVAGHICLDITPAFLGEEVKHIEDILAPGKLISMGNVDVHTGGAVANTGLGMKMLGADVTLIGKVGNDVFGNMILSILKQYHADKGMVISDELSTSYSVVLAMPGIDRIFLHHVGANHYFQAEDISLAQMKEATLLHFGYPPLMKSMYENDGEELLQMMKRAKTAGVATSLDMAAIDAKSQAGQLDWTRILERVLPYVDFFMPSIEELCFMLKPSKLRELQNRSNDEFTENLSMEDIKPLAEQCMQMGVRILLIKCGASGIYYCTAGIDGLKVIGTRAGLDIAKWANKEGFARSYIPEKVLSGTGAGDTSIAAFLTAMLDGYSLEECMELAVATGASCVEAYDALSGLKSFQELKRKISAGWKKNGELKKCW